MIRKHTLAKIKRFIYAEIGPIFKIGPIFPKELNEPKIMALREFAPKVTLYLPCGAGQMMAKEQIPEEPPKIISQNALLYNLRCADRMGW